MPRMMINVQKSELNFEDTVSAVNESVTKEKDWKVPAIFDIQLCNLHFPLPVFRNLSNQFHGITQFVQRPEFWTL
jgi:hypothetical protein